MSGTLVVAFDATQALINRTGVGRYPSELLPRLAALEGLRVIPLAAPGSSDGAGRLAHILRRDLGYYPAGLAVRARRQGARLVHCPAPAPFRAGGLPAVVTVHDVLWLRMPDLFTTTVRAYHHLSVPAVRRARRVLTNSYDTRTNVIELLGVPEERVAVTPFGVDPRFVPRDVDPAWLRKRFGIRARYVLSVATREPRKNLVSVLRAFDGLARRISDVELVLVGGRGWRSQELDRALDAVGDRVRLCGFVSDDELVSLYAGAACFAFPSLAEGFGLPVLEAMACGAPVVTSDRAALPELTGDAALLIDPTEPEGLEAALERVLQEPELATAMACRGRARSASYTWEACAQATLAAYREAECGA